VSGIFISSQRELDSTGQRGARGDSSLCTERRTSGSKVVLKESEEERRTFSEFTAKGRGVTGNVVGVQKEGGAPSLRPGDL